jgi:hypothetical protein
LQDEQDFLKMGSTSKSPVNPENPVHPVDRSSGSQHLARALGRFRGELRAPKPALKPEPTNAFEVAIAERLQSMEREIDRLRSQLTWLFTVIIGFAITNLVIALLK